MVGTAAVLLLSTAGAAAAVVSRCADRSILRLAVLKPPAAEQPTSDINKTMEVYGVCTD
jgi:hypothetical protein